MCVRVCVCLCVGCVRELVTGSGVRVWWVGGVCVRVFSVCV